MITVRGNGIRLFLCVLQRRDVLVAITHTVLYHIVRFCLIYRPMDPLDEVEIEKEVSKTIEGLAKREHENTTELEDWPETKGIPYDLKPKRRNSGLD